MFVFWEYIFLFFPVFPFLGFFVFGFPEANTKEGKTKKNTKIFDLKSEKKCLGEGGNNCCKPPFSFLPLICRDLDKVPRKGNQALAQPTPSRAVVGPGLCPGPTALQGKGDKAQALRP